MNESVRDAREEDAQAISDRASDERNDMYHAARRRFMANRAR